MSGVDVSFLSQSVPDAVKTILPNQFYWQNRDDLKAKLKALNPQLVHAHEEPSWLGWFAKDCLPDTPVVYDCHDSEYIRSGTDTEDERKSLCDSDGVVFPSLTYQKDLSERYGVKLSEVIYSMVNLEDYPDMDMPRVNGIVYEGGVTVTGPVERLAGKMNMNDYRPLAVKLFKAGIPFHIYGGRDKKGSNEYTEAGVVWHQSYQLQTLLQQLARYDWGLVGCAFQNPQWDAAMPNKLFEYVAAGIPCLVYNAKEAGEYVEKHSLGLVVGSVEEIKKEYNQEFLWRKGSQAWRKDYSMSTQMPKLINLYTEVLKSHSLKSSTDTTAAAKPRLVGDAILAGESPSTQLPALELAPELF